MAAEQQGQLCGTLKEAIRNVLDATLDYQRAVEEQRQSFPQPEPRDPLVELQELKERLVRKKLDYTIELQARRALAEQSLKAPQDEEQAEIQIKELQRSIRELEKELSQEVTKLDRDKFILEKAKQNYHAVECLFPREELTSMPNNGRLILEQCQKQAKLSEELLIEEKELNALQSQVRDLEHQSAELETANRHLMARLKDKRRIASSLSPQEQPADQSGYYLEEEIIQIKIRRFALKKLIVASGVNWVEDAHLRELMLSLGSKLDL